MSLSKPLPRHFQSLDILRGMAALVVVLWHWQHFFYQGTELIGFDAMRQPLYQLLRPFYQSGWRAIQLFFCLSGFIFYWLYGSKIELRKVTPWTFAVLRLSRLYPLHLATLLLVAVVQWFYYHKNHVFFVYEFNDAYHFFLQLFMASAWGLERGNSFDAPNWSVSVEVLLYAIFFATCFWGLKRWWHLILLVLASLFFQYQINPLVVGFLNTAIAGALYSFFMGGLSFYVVDSLHRRGFSSRFVLGLGAFTLLAWVANYFSIRFTSRLCSFFLFPLTLTSVALFESTFAVPFKWLAFLGNISYSSYLLHFPLQPGFVLLGPPSGSPFYNSPVSLILFFSLLIPLSLASYRYLERPAQRFLRNLILGSSSLT